MIDSPAATAQARTLFSIENTQPLADFVEANDIDGTRVRLSEACGVTQIDTGF